MRAWSPAAEDKLRALYRTEPLPRLAFLLKRTEKAIRSRAKVLGLRRTDRRAWTRKEDALLRKRFASEQTADLARELGRSASSTAQRGLTLGLRKSKDTIAECTRRRWREGRHENSRNAQFKPGQVPPNKGLRRPGWAPGRMASTQFKKGSMSGAAQHNYVPVGTEKLDAKRGVIVRKITDDQSIYPAARWRPVHTMVWEAANGPVPAGHVCVFRPGMKTHDSAQITLDRLEVVSHAELMRRNSYHTRYPELAPLIQLKGALNRKINNATRARQ